ncbi:MAG: DNA polymerase III subunit delta' [Sphingomonadaceae bacterium]
MQMIGHDAAWQQWREAMSGGRMAHGWILAGRKGLGKRHFADQAARELVGVSPALNDSAAHPDILVLTHLPKDEKEEKKRDEGKDYQRKRNITIDQIRGMQRRLTTRPTLGDRRVVIIDPADDLENNAANALLKCLEEPPAGTFFLLVSHRPASLLPTIRSRCRMMRFPLLTEQEIDTVLQSRAAEADQDMRAASIAAAGGSPGVALEFLDQDLCRIDTLLREISRQKDPHFTLRGQLVAEVGPRADRVRIQALIELARAVLVRKMHDIPRDALPDLVDSYNELNRLAGEAPIYNFDTGLLVMEIGGLLARTAPSREPDHG